MAEPVDLIADILARTYDGKVLTDLRAEHAEHHREAAAAVRDAIQHLLATPAHAFRVTEIRDNVVRRVHGYHTSLEGAFAYCEQQERTPGLIPSAYFELAPAPGGTQWLVLSYYKPGDPCPDISDLIITRVDITPDETQQA